jgi:hypothetical protein
MDDPTHSRPRPSRHQSTAWLLRELAGDVRDLAEAGVADLRTEVRSEIRQTREAAVTSVVGLFVAALGLLVLLLGGCQLIALAGIPLWASYLVVGAALLVLGLVLANRAKNSHEAGKLEPGKLEAGKLEAGKLEAGKSDAQALMH